MGNSSFIISDQAAERIKRIIADEKLGDHAFLRITVEGGGCSGFQNKMSMDDSPLNDDDIVFEHSGAKVVIDSISIFYLNGSSLEFENSLGGAFLKIKNPNAASSCGCGVSFDMKYT